MLRLPALVLAVLAVSSPAAHADCAPGGLEVKVVTPSGTLVPPDGGVLVVALPGGRELAEGDITLHPTWQISDWNGSKTSPKLVKVAPGLAVYGTGLQLDPPPPRGVNVIRDPDADKLELVDGKTTLLSFEHDGRKRPKLAAPKVKSVRFSHVMTRRSSTTITAELAEAPPAGAYALVLADRKGTPRSWGAVDATALTQIVYAARDCQAQPNGTLPTNTKDKVTLFWVMLDGRRSPASRPVAVR